MVTIEVQEPNGTKSRILQDLPLTRIALDDKSDPCNTNLIIEGGLEKPVRHVVIEPIHIRLKHEGEGERYHRVQIVAENGTTTAIMHPGLSPELLSGLKTE